MDMDQDDRDDVRDDESMVDSIPDQVWWLPIYCKSLEIDICSSIASCVPMEVNWSSVASVRVRSALARNRRIRVV